MNLPVLPKLRPLIIHAGMTILVILPLNMAHAREGTITLKQNLNSYVYEGHSIDLAQELEITEKDQVIQINIRAQAIEHNANIELIVNDKSLKTQQLEDSIKVIKFKLKKNEKLKKLEIRSKGAFVGLAKARLVSEELIDGDLSRKNRSTSQEPAPSPNG
ncbi:MAG: hypothetical protein ACJAS4_002900 [Bacteriovoracaceae bacterium]|jgi:hypothetical protein